MTSDGDSVRQVRVGWSDAVTLWAVAHGRKNSLPSKLRKRLESAATGSDQTAVRRPMIMIAIDVADINLILSSDHKELRGAARSIARHIDCALEERDHHAGEQFSAANLTRKPYSATRIRSVVRGGLPDSSRTRH